MGNTKNKNAQKKSGAVIKQFINKKTIIIAVSVILLACILIFVILSSNDYCKYAKSRDVSERDIHYVEMSVSGYGKIIILLDATTAPITVDNFLTLVNKGFYDGLTFHRVMEDFMIQGGDPNANGSGGSDDEIIGEFELNGTPNDISHIRGVISMARSDYYNSASSQFFICNADSTFLDGSYAAFGYVVKGMKVVDNITRSTVRFANASSGGIANKKNQAVIEYIKVLENYNQ